MRLRLAPIALAALAVAGCETPTQAALEREVAALTQRSERERAMVEKIDETRAQRARVLARLAEIGSWDPGAPSIASLSSASAAAGACARVSIGAAGNAPIVTLDGTGSPAEAAACLDRFASKEPAMVLRSLHADAHAWRMELGRRAPEGAAAAAADALPEDPAGGLPLPAVKRLREQAAERRAEIAMYDAQLGDLARLPGEEARLESLLTAIHDEPDRLDNARRFWDAAWAGRDAPLAAGSVRIEAGVAHLEGPIAPGLDAATLASIASARHLEIASVDAANASLTGTFTPEKGP